MKRTPTPEQKAKAEERRATLRALAERIASTSEAERIALTAEMPTVLTCEGHLISPKNTMLLSFQYGAVSMVGGYNQWKKANRQVKKGERALGIWIPTGTKDESKPDETPSGFIFGSVFDITQTDPIEKGKTE